MNSTIILRDRGQLTLPEAIRKTLPWLTRSTALTVSVENPQKLVLTPLQPAATVPWDMMWNGITLARSFEGQGRNLSQSIADDREDR